MENTTKQKQFMIDSFFENNFYKGFVCTTEANTKLSEKDRRDYDESLQDLINFAKKEVKVKK